MCCTIYPKSNSLQGINCLKPGGAFYVFPNIKETGFFGEGYSEYIRFCYASSKEDINEAIERMDGVLKN